MDKKASDIPSYTTFEDFDVQSGKPFEQEGYMQASFQTSDMTSDMRFTKAAELMGDSSGSLMSDATRLSTPSETNQDAKVKKQAKEAAL